jgi:hypothetical protein
MWQTIPSSYWRTYLASLCIVTIMTHEDCAEKESLLFSAQSFSVRYRVFSMRMQGAHLLESIGQVFQANGRLEGSGSGGAERFLMANLFCIPTNVLLNGKSKGWINGRIRYARKRASAPRTSLLAPRPSLLAYLALRSSLLPTWPRTFRPFKTAPACRPHSRPHALAPALAPATRARSPAIHSRDCAARAAPVRPRAGPVAHLRARAAAQPPLHFHPPTSPHPSQGCRRCSAGKHPGEAWRLLAPPSTPSLFECDMRPRGEWQVYQHH